MVNRQKTVTVPPIPVLNQQPVIDSPLSPDFRILKLVLSPHMTTNANQVNQHIILNQLPKVVMVQALRFLDVFKWLSKLDISTAGYKGATSKKCESYFDKVRICT